MLKDRVIKSFDYAKQNSYFKILIGDFVKNERSRGISCPPNFWSIKNGTRAFNVWLNEPSCDIFGPLGRYYQPWEEKTNNHASVIFLLAKNTKLHILYIEALKLYCRVF